MKKIFQFGFVAALVALLPAGLLRAGNGDGDNKDKKKVVTVNNTERSTSIQLVLFTPDIDINNIHQIQIHTKGESASVTDFRPSVGGLIVNIAINPDVVDYINPDSDIIIEIVGVDNITGVGASDGNSGTSIPSNIVFEDDQNSGVVNNDQGIGSSNFQGNSGNFNNNATNIFSGNKNDINIFPNPVTDETNVVTVGEILGRSIQIMDLSGHVVMNMNVAANSRQTVLNLSMLNPGIYILSYTTEDGRIISKKLQKV